MTFLPLINWPTLVNFTKSRRCGYIEARRRIICAKDTAQQMSIHPFFIAAKAQNSINSYLQKTVLVLEDHVSRTHELTNETNILISLVSGTWLEIIYMFTDAETDIQYCNVAGYKGCGWGKSYSAASVSIVVIAVSLYIWIKSGGSPFVEEAFPTIIITVENGYAKVVGLWAYGLWNTTHKT